MEHQYKRIAIVQRGEAAMRLIRAVRELNREMHLGLVTIALFTTPDRFAQFVCEADEVIEFGPATFFDEETKQCRSSYFDRSRIERALLEAHADALWAGWGPIAQEPWLAELCQALSILYIGPDLATLRLLHDKVRTKQVAERSGLPTVPWGKESVEQAMDNVRSIEVQVAADRYGTLWAMGVRDCSVQRHYQPVLAEAGTTLLTSELEQQLCRAATQLCRAVDYRGIGTVEFLVDVDTQRFWLLAMNACPGAEHPVTEAITGLNLIKLQLRIALGEHLPAEPPVLHGFAVLAHLYAEDPDHDFAPGSGTLDLFQLAGGPGVRIDSGLHEGDSIAPPFDLALATITAWGHNRQEALACLYRVLAESAIVIRGGMSSKAFLLRLLSQPELEKGNVTTDWLDRLITAGIAQTKPYADVALLQAAIDVYEAESQVEQVQFYTSAARGRPRARVGAGIGMDFYLHGHSYRFVVARLGAQRYRLLCDGQRIDVRAERLNRFERRLTYGGRRYRIVAVAYGPTHRVEVDGVAHHIVRGEGGLVRAPGPSVVVSIAVAVGDRVEAGDRLIVVEAMKMEQTLTAPFAGYVSRVLVSSNVQVDAGAPLLQLRPLTHQDASMVADRIAFAATSFVVASPRQRCGRTLEALHNQMLGYDFDQEEAQRLRHEMDVLYQLLPADDQELQRGEDDVLSIFADVSVLFRSVPDADTTEERDVQVHSTEQDLLTYLRSHNSRPEQLSPAFLRQLKQAMAHYNVKSLDPSPLLDDSLLLLYKAYHNSKLSLPMITAILRRRLAHLDSRRSVSDERWHELLDRLFFTTQGRYPTVHDLVGEMRFRSFEEPLFALRRERVYQEMADHLTFLAEHPDTELRQQSIAALVACPYPLHALLTSRCASANITMQRLMLEVLTRRYYRIRLLEEVRTWLYEDQAFAQAAYDFEGARIHVVTMFADAAHLDSAIASMARFVADLPAEDDVVTDFYIWHPEPLDDREALQEEIRDQFNAAHFSRPIRRIVAAVVSSFDGVGRSETMHFTYRLKEGLYQESLLYRGLHPMMGKRLNIWRLANFHIKRLPSVEDVYLFHGIARDNPKDERLFAIAEVRDVTRDSTGQGVQIPHLERMFLEALAGIRLYQSQLPTQQRLTWNRVFLYVWPLLDLKPEEIVALMQSLWPFTDGLGLEKVVIIANLIEDGVIRQRVLHIANPGGRELVLRLDVPRDAPISTLDEYRQKVVQLRRRGLVYPYEIIRLLTPADEHTHSVLPSGDFTEYDLDDHNQLVAVERPYGQNRAGLVVGVIRNYTAAYPEGMQRVILLGDPSKNMGSVAEPECRRINAAIDLAKRLQIPLEWFTLSAGARIALESGTENMDWVARTLRRIIEYTQSGGRINIVVNGINVGAQPYWNAEATFLMHTRGTLIMTPNGAMVLTGKQSLDYSGGVSAEDNYGIGGYERVMGPNGEAQYFALDLSSACQLLIRYYEHTYVAPGERFPRRVPTVDPIDRDVRTYPYHGTRPDDQEITCVGDLFSAEKNGGRKHPFDMRNVMASLIDSDHLPLERWHDMRNAESAIIWDAHIGGYPVAMIGIESHPLTRSGFIPGDGPEQWTAGTLFPLSSKKIARALNSASGNRPVVVVANLSGFDGSPESMYNTQLEFGAEIGRAVVNFQGPIIFCTVSRFHGGSFVVFSQTLNEGIESAAVEGSYASVIGGVPAAAVVFAREVATRVKKDPRVQQLQTQLAQSDSVQKAILRSRLDLVTEQVRSEKVGEIANEFDHIHDIQRAQRVGSVEHVIPAATLRPYLVAAIERGIARELAHCTLAKLAHAGE